MQVARQISKRRYNVFIVLKLNGIEVYFFLNRMKGIDACPDILRACPTGWYLYF